MKFPAITFYVGDWRKDVGVQSLDYEARGVWIEMLFLMHESETRGRLTLNGKPMGRDQLARLLGVQGEHLGKILDRLFEAGVPSRDTDGTIYSRRMVRDEELRNSRVESGKMGGNPKLCQNYNKPGFVYAMQRASDGAVKIGISTSPSKRLYKVRYQLKCECELLAFRHVQDMGTAEKELHSQYASKASGEWFFLTPKETKSLVFYLKGKSKGFAEDESENENENEVSSKQGEHEGDVSEVYDLYPRKVDPDAARKAIQKAISKHGLVLIREKTEAYAKLVEFLLPNKADRKFIPYPATWFNAGGFLSDPDEWRVSIGANGNGKPLSVFELKTIKETKEKQADELKNRHSSEGPLSHTWSDIGKREEYKKLRREIKELNTRIGAFA